MSQMKARKGISYLEYALLAALVGIVGAVGVMKYGSAISEFFSSLANKTTDYDFLACFVKIIQ